MRLPWPVMVVLALSACGGTTVVPVTRPQWRGAAIDGIAPLMSPRQVEAALHRNGYAQVPCRGGGKLLVRPLYEGNALACYRSPVRPMWVNLYFLEMKQGRGLERF